MVVAWRVNNLDRVLARKKLKRVGGFEIKAYLLVLTHSLDHIK